MIRGILSGGRALALSNLRFCVSAFCELSYPGSDGMPLYIRGAKLAIFYGSLCFFRSEMRGDVSLVLWFSMVKIKKGHSAIL